MSTSKYRTIGVMTSGGDAPGMNSCIRSVVRSASAEGLKVVGIQDAYEGLIHGQFIEMGPRDVGGILQRGGTILQTARSEEFRTVKGQREALRQLNGAGIEALVVIGGDGSLTGAQKLAEQGVPVIGVPASIDNDMYGTDMAIGVDTALNTIVDAVDKLRDTASSHNRAFLVETMGRNCGYLALQGGIICGAELVLVPEFPTPVSEVANAIDEAYKRGKTHCIIMVAEGFTPNSNEIKRQVYEMDLGFSIRVTILGHIQRGGKPSAFDRLLASRLGVKAVEFLVNGQTNVMAGLDGRDIIPVPLQVVTSKKRILTEENLAMARLLAR